MGYEGQARTGGERAPGKWGQRWQEAGRGRRVCSLDSQQDNSPLAGFKILWKQEQGRPGGDRERSRWTGTEERLGATRLGARPAVRLFSSASVLGTGPEQAEGWDQTGQASLGNWCVLSGTDKSKQDSVQEKRERGRGRQRERGEREREKERKEGGRGRQRKKERERDKERKERRREEGETQREKERRREEGEGAGERKAPQGQGGGTHSVTRRQAQPNLGVQHTAHRLTRRCTKPPAPVHTRSPAPHARVCADDTSLGLWHRTVAITGSWRWLCGPSHVQTSVFLLFLPGEKHLTLAPAPHGGVGDL